MNAKKLLAIVLSVAMVLSMASFSAFAATELPAAVDGVITLTEDVVLSATAVIAEDTTIDLAGYTITTADSADTEAYVTTLIFVKDGATLTVTDSVGNGKIVGGTRTNSKSFNGLCYTINVSSANLIVDGAIIEGSKGINTKYGATAINAGKANGATVGSTVTIIDSIIKGGDVEKVDVTSANAGDLYHKNQGEAGVAVYAHTSTVNIINSEIYGGNGLAKGATQTSYISGGANFGAGGEAIEISQEVSSATITDSIIKAGDSDLYNTEAGISVHFGASLSISGSTVTGGSCLVQNGYGAAGAGIYTNQSNPTIAIDNCEITGGSTDDSSVGSGIEVGRTCTNAALTVENSTITTGGGSGNSTKTYTIKANEADDIASVSLTDAVLATSDDAAGVISTAIGKINAEGTLTVSSTKNLSNITVETVGGVTVNGDDTVVPKVVVARIGKEGYETLRAAFLAATDGAVVDLLGGTIVVANEDAYNAFSTYKLPNNITVKNGTLDFTGVSISDSAFRLGGGYGLKATFENVDFIKNATEPAVDALYIVSLQSADAAVTFTDCDIDVADVNDFVCNLSGAQQAIFNGGTIVAGEGVHIVQQGGVLFNGVTVNAPAARLIHYNMVPSTIKNSTIVAQDATMNVGTLDIIENSYVELNSLVGHGGNVTPGIVTVDATSNLIGEDITNALLSGTTAGEVISKADALELVFVENTTAVPGSLDNSVWDIVLKAANSETINRLNSADFTFELVSAHDMDYEIVATNGEIAINEVSPDRYEFHFEHKNDAADTEAEIVLGQVRFTGYGVFAFGVNTREAAANSNEAHATELHDNIVDSFKIIGAEDVNDGDGDLVVNVDNNAEDDGVIEDMIEVATKDLTINIDFNNAVAKNAVDYQDMKVVVSGGDLKAPVEIKLDNADRTVALDATYVDDKSEAAYAVDASVDNKYIVTLTAALTENIAYNVTVSGAGYRTARYTVTMTADKTLNFWNNVMDVDQVIETGKAASATKLNFLAGDILEDNKINIYDLSAVVSYFGETGNVENGYAQYDLNRDTKIDSKDVAYVLVSWNN